MHHFWYSFSGHLSFLFGNVSLFYSTADPCIEDIIFIGCGPDGCTPGSSCGTATLNSLSVLVGSVPANDCLSTLYLSSTGQSSSSTSNTLVIVLAVVIPVSILLAALVAIFLIVWRKRESKATSDWVKKRQMNREVGATIEL